MPTCKVCSKDFKKKSTLKKKSDKFKDKFCGKDCAEAYARAEAGKATKKQRKLKVPQSSKEEKEFGNIIRTFFPKLESQYVIPGCRHHYDFYSPELNMIIEYNGVYWHNMPKNRIKDREHLKEATQHGVYVSVVTDVEWKAFIDSGVPDKKKLVKLLDHSTKNMKK